MPRLTRAVPVAGWSGVDSGRGHGGTSDRGAGTARCTLIVGADQVRTRHARVRTATVRLGAGRPRPASALGADLSALRPCSPAATQTWPAASGTPGRRTVQVVPSLPLGARTRWRCRPCRRAGPAALPVPTVSDIGRDAAELVAVARSRTTLTYWTITVVRAELPARRWPSTAGRPWSAASAAWPLDQVNWAARRRPVRGHRLHGRAARRGRVVEGEARRRWASVACGARVEQRARRSRRSCTARSGRTARQ